MAKTRVLIVDDSVVVRKILTDVLKDDPEIEVAGIAANGRIALQKISQVNPDILTMDVEMPDMNGLETLVEVRKKYPRLPVIMFSTLTQRGAEATIDALTMGANDYVTKPANVGSVTAAIESIRAELVPKIKHWALGEAVKVPRPRVQAAPKVPMPAPAQHRQVDVVVIGVSTGGPNALAELVPAIPADFPVPVLIVQHMPPVFTQTLAERLNSRSEITVREGREGEPIAAGEAWIAPGGFHMTVVPGKTGFVLRTNQDPPENSCRPAVDVLFRSAVDAFGSNVLAIVLTGMGQDGLRGCERIREAGGLVFVQDEASSVVWGMPGYVAQAGLAHKVLPLPEIAIEMTRQTANRRRRTLEIRAGR